METKYQKSPGKYFFGKKKCQITVNPKIVISVKAINVSLAKILEKSKKRDVILVNEKSLE